MAARQELHSGLSEMATQTQNYKLHKFELKDAPADITAINASMDIIDTQLKALADGKFDKTGGTISGNLVVNGSTTLKKLTASELDLNGNADVSGTLKVAGATTLTGKLTANGGVTTKALTATNLDLNGNGDVSGSLTVHGDLNAQGGLNVTDITATGATTLVNLNAANITATGTLKVNGATTLTGLLAANGGVTTKKVTATELDLNGNGDVSGNLNVGGLLQVTGSIWSDGTIYSRKDRAFEAYAPNFDVKTTPSNEFQWWPLNVYDKNYATAAVLKYIKETDGRSQIILADIAYPNGTAHWSQISVGHNADGSAFFATGCPATFSGGIYVSGGGLTLTGTMTATGSIASQSVVRAVRFDTSGSSGNVIRTNVKGATKGQTPSSNINTYWGIYDEHGVAGAANQLAAISHVLGSGGSSVVNISAYKNDPSVQSNSTLTVGWNASGERYVETNGSLTVANGIKVEAGGVDSSGPFITHSTVGLDIQRSDLDPSTMPSAEKNLWHCRIKDKDGRTVSMLKYMQHKSGRQTTLLDACFYKPDGSIVYCGVTVGFDFDGTPLATLTQSPVTESNDNSIATTAWVTQKVNSNKLTIGNPVSQGASTSGSCTKNTIVYINSSGSLSDVKINGTTVATTSGYHAEQAQQVTLFVPAGGTWSVGHTGNGSVTSVLYQEIN